MTKIITMGEILVEIMAKDVGQSFRQPGVLLGPYASGAPAIFIDQVGKLGCAAGMIGCVGDDDFGHLNTERLSADGVDVSGIAFLPDATTGSAFVTYRSDGNRDFVFNIVNSASARLDAEHVTPQTLDHCTHFHVMGSSLFSDTIVAAMKKAVDLVKRQGGTVSFDPNIRKEILRSGAMREALAYFLARTDIFLPSGDEVTLLVDADTEEAAIPKLLALGIKEIVVKRGSGGASYVDRDRRIDVQALAVTEVDPTGAGDCFGGAFVACRQLGMPPAEALQFANAAGAMAVTRRGPMEGASTFEQLREALGQRF
jgi:sugar/nucleoside kinase (ribokinase family)